MLQKIEINNIRLDGGTQAPDRLNPEIIQSYADDMLNELWDWNTSFEPVVVYHDGTDYWLAHGFHRVNAAIRAGLADVYAEVRHGTRSEAQWFAYGSINSRNGERVTNDQKRWKVKNALQHPQSSGLTDVQIAQHCGVDNKTVGNYRKAITGNSNDSQPVERTATRNGTTYTINTANIGRKLPPIQANGNGAVAIPAPSGTEDNEEEHKYKIKDSAPRGGNVATLLVPQATRQSQPMQIMVSQETDEWYTPEEYIAAVRDVLGHIDLDPASSETANQTVRASRIFTQDTDGLSRNWGGCIFSLPKVGDAPLQVCRPWLS
jgi:hypothetical protein